LDPESRLRKVIWFYLWYFTTNLKYFKILYFDCLSSPNFYQTQGFHVIRRYSNILLLCLNYGVEAGKFRTDLDMKLVRDVILGFLGCELMSFVAMQEIDTVLTDQEDILDLVMGILKLRDVLEKTKVDKILDAAENIFANKSIYNARITEIAKLAGVAEGTVYEYFGNKENLLSSILQRRLLVYVDDLTELFEIKKPIQKLRRFTKHYFSIFFKERNFMKTFLMQGQFTRQFYKTEQRTLFLKFFTIIQEIIMEGISQRCFRSSVNPRVFRNMLIGTFTLLSLRWFVTYPERNVDKMQKIDEVTDILCAAILNFDKSSPELVA